MRKVCFLCVLVCGDCGVRLRSTAQSVWSCASVCSNVFVLSRERPLLRLVSMANACAATLRKLQDLWALRMIAERTIRRACGHAMGRADLRLTYACIVIAHACNLLRIRKQRSGDGSGPHAYCACCRHSGTPGGHPSDSRFL